MATNQQLTVIERELAPIMAPISHQLAELLPPALPVERLLQTLYVSCARNPSLMRCNRQSLVNSALSAAVLGLEVDGVSGQGYLVPFKGDCQFLVGYKGYVALAARVGRSLEGFIAREGDEFQIDEANGRVHYQRQFGREAERQMIAAFAVSRGEGMPTMVRALSYDQVIERRNRSAGWKSRGERSPWGTDFDSMARKCPMRDLAKDLPALSLQIASSLETQHDLGHVAHLNPGGGVVVDSEPASGPSEAPAQPSARDLVGEGDTPEHKYVIYFPSGLGTRSYATLAEYASKMRVAIARAGVHLSDLRSLNEDFIMSVIREEDSDTASDLVALFDAQE